MLQFVSGYDGINQRWEEFHAAFDGWREGLIACDASSVQVKLREFAGQFTGITEDARALPRSPGVRGLADLLIGAIEAEEDAIRRLRDSWRPDDPGVFEDVDSVRAASSSVRKQAQDEIKDLQERASPSPRLLIGTYTLAFQQVNSRWDAFHQNYDAFRAQEADLISLEVVDRLSALIGDFRGIVSAIRNLPDPTVARQVSGILAQAAGEEDLALRKLRGTFEKSEVPLDGESFPTESQDGGVGPSGETSGGQFEVIFTPQDPTLFNAFDAQLVTSNALRREAGQLLANIVESTSEGSQAALGLFREQHNLLVQAWDDFHMDYDRWRRTEGGCDRSQAIGALGSFSLRFDNLASDVRELPRATFLRPLGELLVEAAERESQALRLLRNTWRPFDAEVYKVLDRERSSVGRLRRQVAAGIHDLLARYDISAGDRAS